MIKTLVILGHPRVNSLGGQLARDYAESANAPLLNLTELPIDWTRDPRDQTTQEPEIERVQAMIADADHLVFVFPSWWGTFPALLKGFFDRVFLSDFAFRYTENSEMPQQLLKGKTADLVITMDAPTFWYRWFQVEPGVNALKRAILGFCGVKVRKTLILDRVRVRKPEAIEMFRRRVRERAATVAGTHSASPEALRPRA